MINENQMGIILIIIFIVGIMMFMMGNIKACKNEDKCSFSKRFKEPLFITGFVLMITSFAYFAIKYDYYYYFVNV
jgi:hypothetical protein